MKITPDSVCAKYGRKGSVTIRALEEDMILIEADREGLEFLGNLLLAQAQAEDCGFQIGPNGAGKTLFSKESTKGIYLHRLPSTPPNRDRKDHLSPELSE